MRKKLAKVKLERNILEKCAGCLKASTRVNLNLSINIYPFPGKGYVQDSRCKYQRLLQMEKQGTVQKDQHNLVLLEQIKKIHYRNRKRYGSPRIARELEASRFHTSEKLIRKLMKSGSLQSVFKRKYRTTTNSSHKYPVAENVLDRKFTVSNINEVWVSDITYIKASFRWLYLTVIIVFLTEP